MIDGLAGVTSIETSDALVTVKVADPDTPLMLAVILAVPPATALARPATPLKFMVATEADEELHVT